ncbi:MAG: hypothetical protein WAW80_01745 [Candidatus Saccharimonadales bacterium]
MLNKTTKKITAVQLQIILLVSIILLTLVTVIIFLYFRSQLVSYATQVQEDNAKAATSSSDVIKLKNLKKELEDNQVAVNRTKSIAADSKQYQYQNQIIEEVMAYAKKANITLGGLTFNSDPAVAAPAIPATAASPTAEATSPAGLKTVSVTVSIKSPVNYESVIKFIHYIEVNLTKMQISGVSLAKSGNDKSLDVNVDPITIEVYTR